MPALRHVPASVGEGFEAARIAAGYKRVDDAADASGVSRDFIYQIERIGNRPNAGNPSLSVLTTLANLYGVELGDCFPSTRVVAAEVQSILDPLATLSASDRREVIRAMSHFVGTLVARTRVADHNEMSANAVNTSAIKYSRTDSEGAEVAAVGTGSVKEPAHVQPAARQNQATEKIKKAGKRR